MTLGAERLRRVSLQAIKSLGGFQLLLDSAWRRRRLLILCYHGVSIDDEHEWNPALYMPVHDFEERLRILRASRCSVLALDDAVRRLYAGTLPRRSVVLTFDDGYFDFYQQAFPLLREFDMPATVYLATLRCGHSRPVFRLVCSYMLWKLRGKIVDASGLIGAGATFDLRSDEGRARALEVVIDASGHWRTPFAAKDELAARLGGTLGLDYEEIARRRLLTIMTPDEVRTLSASGVDFQLHTHTHTTPRDPEAFKTELLRNRQIIEAMTGQPATHFCYPSGLYRPEFLPWLSERSVRSATTCDPALATPATNPLLLPRFVDGTRRSTIEFQGWVAGAASLISKQRSYAGVTE